MNAKEVVILVFCVFLVILPILAYWSEHKPIFRKVFTLDWDMGNVNSLYAKICAYDKPYVLVYTNNSLHISLKMRLYDSSQYFPTVLRLYMLRIEDVFLPNDNDLNILTLFSDMSNYPYIYYRLKENSYNVYGTNIFMIKIYNAQTDEVAYKVFTKIDEALDYLKLVRNIHALETCHSSVDTNNTNISDCIDNNSSVPNDTIIENHPVEMLKCFDIISGKYGIVVDYINNIIRDDEYDFDFVIFAGCNDYCSMSCDNTSTLIDQTIFSEEEYIDDISNTYHLYKIECILIDEGGNHRDINDIMHIINSSLYQVYICIISKIDKQILLTDSPKYMEEYLLKYKKG